MYLISNRDFDSDLIIPGLYLGSECNNKKSLKENNITNIINMKSEISERFSSFSIFKGFDYLRIYAKDEENVNLLSIFKCPI